MALAVEENLAAGELHQFIHWLAVCCCSKPWPGHIVFNFQRVLEIWGLLNLLPLDKLRQSLSFEASCTEAKWSSCTLIVVSWAGLAIMIFISHSKL